MFLAVVVMVACQSSPKTSHKDVKKESKAASYEVVLSSEVEWTYLNPARGDLAPRAATLWGDRNGDEPTGFLLKPFDGFQSPPHIHNISYRGIVINGVIHNDDPQAGEMWMPATSFWTQPKGHVHITAAKGENPLAYIEIDRGPYLVLPAGQQFDSGERPVNMDASNLVWLDAAQINWLNPEQQPLEGVRVAFLWGKRQTDNSFGLLVKIPNNFKGEILSHGPRFRSVVIAGTLTHRIPGAEEVVVLDAGSYFASQEAARHLIATNNQHQCIFYVRSNGPFEIGVD